VFTLTLFLALPPAAPAGEAKVPDKTAARNRLVAWLRANDRHGPEIVARDMLPFLDAELPKCQHYSVVLGRGSTRSGKTYSLDVWADTLLVTELPDEAAAAWGIRDNGFSLQTGMKKQDRKLPLSPLRLDAVTVDRARSLPGDRPVTGQLGVTVFDKPPANLAVRLSLPVGGNTISLLDYLDQGVPRPHGTVPFTFNPINRKGDREIQGPALAIVDLVAVKQQNNDVTFTIVSNPVAVLLEIEGVG
jgi:hypothetical protein